MSITSTAAGTWLHHPVTGELARVNVSPADTGGRRLEVDLWLQPGATVARAHVHEHVVERFEVLEGDVGVEVAGREHDVRPGDPPVEVPARTAHDWWNAGAGIAHVRVDIAATPSARGRPAQRFLSMIEAMWSLGALGRVDAHGMPTGLWLAASAREYRDAIRFATPPRGGAGGALRAAGDPRPSHGPRPERARAPRADGRLRDRRPRRGRPRRAARRAG
jgi:mannose-6-phosphate isomerase-like protein (cupin superfamily)